METESMLNEKIDDALRAVGHAAPVPGLAQRISLRLESAAAEGSARRFYWPRVLIPVAGCAVVALLMVAGVRMQERTHIARKDVGMPQARTFASISKEAIPVPGPASSEATVPPVIIPPGVDAGRSRTQRNGLPARRASHRVRHSFPDNYPLTHQERLLIQLVKTVNPETLQILNPAYRAAQEAKENAAFEAYVHESDTASDNSTAADAATSTTQTENNTQTTQEGTTL